jgi:hypothetical protein
MALAAPDHKLMIPVGRAADTAAAIAAVIVASDAVMSAWSLLRFTASVAAEAVSATVSFLPAGIVIPAAAISAILTPRIDALITPADWRYQPLLVSLEYVMPGAETPPSGSLIGDSIAPFPVRSNEFVSAEATSENVALAHVELIAVPVETGLPTGRV